MIGFLEGVLLEKHPNQALVKVGGVGYQVFISLNTFYALPEPPGPVSLQIHTRIQDDALQLFGFHTSQEKDLFLELISIPRIGPRIALNILSGISPTEFHQALAQRDVKRLASIPGLGRKSAERITLELKDRLAATDRGRPAPPGDRLYQDALSALVNLGYPKNTAEKALAAVRNQGANTLEDLLRQSLKVLAR
ncbi:MAG: Holliday junction DNA helicase RuvA [Deltaproteobacteria bacterium RBG_13_58_19]|nr:MAG: Holliday junction DNA helicase RuvA [Deltaproteobacteria bacterium RBG_13_58_19]